MKALNVIFRLLVIATCIVTTVGVVIFFAKALEADGNSSSLFMTLSYARQYLQPHL